ncbi:MAG: hypothetical protein ABIP97_13975, partial [Chthoniobacterales bacterium]
QKFRDPNSIFLRQENERILMDDILEARNQFILAKIEESAPRYDHVVVPWGAMHMPFLEQKLREKGYHEIQRTDRRAVAFF